MNVLEVDNIELNFGSKQILNAIYFKAEKGQVTGILGSNGSGKTSLLRIIFGELRPNNKLIRIDHKPILNALYKNEYIKYLPQFHSIPNSFTIKKAFYYFSCSVDAFVNDFPNFKKYKNLRFSELSGGERRLIEVYLHIKSDAKIILLDEPFSHLAPLYIEKIKEIIAIEKKHKIFVITDHLFKDILDISDAIYLLKNGWSKLIKNTNDLIFYRYTNSI
ncbi:ATP-binding cassette domain-containing protein [Polaribacter sp. M15]